MPLLGGLRNTQELVQRTPADSTQEDIHSPLLQEGIHTVLVDIVLAFVVAPSRSSPFLQETTHSFLLAGFVLLPQDALADPSRDKAELHIGAVGTEEGTVVGVEEGAAVDSEGNGVDAEEHTVVVEDGMVGVGEDTDDMVDVGGAVGVEGVAAETDSVVVWTEVELD